MRFDTSWVRAEVAQIRDLTPNIREFSLRPSCGAMSYPTGAHLRVEVEIDGQAVTRHYSLIGRPRGDTWRIAVKREEPGRGGSRFMWSLKLGDSIKLSMPDSHFELAPNAAAYLLIAGGIGITPILGMAEVLQRRAAKFRLLYAGRSRSETAYLPELTVELGGAVELFFSNESNFIDLESAFADLAADGEVYICGPISLLNAAKTAWAAAGRPPTRLRFETFGSSGRFETKAFTVRIPRLNMELEVPAGTSLLDALEASGVGVLADCRRGECGLCVLNILDCNAEIDHRDVFFSDRQRAEGNKICVCVSRVAGGILTLEPAYRGDPLLKA